LQKNATEEGSKFKNKECTLALSKKLLRSSLTQHVDPTIRDAQLLLTRMGNLNLFLIGSYPLLLRLNGLSCYVYVLV